MSTNRQLVLEVAGNRVPALDGAELLASAGGRHQYRFDASRVSLQALIEQAAAQSEILDVETHRPDIDDVVADLYESWRGRPPCLGSG